MITITEEQEEYIGSLTRCLDCNDENEHTFHFNRLLAARTALYLSSEDPATIANAGDTGTHSALFMSICYYAGGFPMIGDESAGWAAHYAYGEIASGSTIWNFHSTDYVVRPAKDGAYGADSDWTPIPTSQVGGKKLVHLLANPLGADVQEDRVESIPAGAIIEWNSRRSALLVPTRLFVNESSNLTAQYFDPARDWTQLNEDGLNNIRRYRAGDYVWYPVGTLAHGLMIVGYGPPISWYDYMNNSNATMRVSEDLPDPQKGFRFELEVTSGAVADHSDVFGVVDVPYVADWQTGTTSQREKRQGPRPFYATRAGAGDWPIQAQHPYWVFIPVPDQCTVACNHVTGANCIGDPIQVGEDGVPRPAP